MTRGLRIAIVSAALALTGCGHQSAGDQAEGTDIINARASYGFRPVPDDKLAELAAKGMERCTGCHSLFQGNFVNQTPDRIYGVLTQGAMRPMAVGLSDESLRAIAQTMGNPDADKVSLPNGGAKMCAANQPLDKSAGTWGGWSPDAAFTRYSPQPMTAGALQKSAVSWAFGFPNRRMWEGASNPTVSANGRIYVGSTNNFLYSLDAKTGCAHWAHELKGWIRSAPAVANGIIAVGDNIGHVYAFDEASGKPLWHDAGDGQPGARITGSVTISGGTLYVPVSSMDQTVRENARKFLPCCTFIGSVIAYDLRSGKRLWRTPMLQGKPRIVGKTEGGMDLTGPAGAAIYTAPLADPARGLVYVTTAHQTAGPKEPGGIALVALDMKTGAIRWTKSFAEEAEGSAETNSYELNVGRDGDFQAPPILVNRPDGKQIMLLGNKESLVYAVDPAAQGKVLWQVRTGRGGAVGGVTFGMATDGKLLYVPMYDLAFTEHGRRLGKADPKDAGPALSSMAALDLMTGRVVWRSMTPANGCQGKDPNTCSPALFGPATLIGDVVFAGGGDGIMRGYDKTTGRIVWSFDTVKSFTTVNGLAAKGGGFSMGGVTYVNGMLYLNSGSGIYGTGMPGNALIAIKVPG